MRYLMACDEGAEGCREVKAVMIVATGRAAWNLPAKGISLSGPLLPLGRRPVITSADASWSIEMNMNKEEVVWIEVRDVSGKLLFKYNPVRNEVELKPKGSDTYVIVRLDELRIKHGYTPLDMNIVFVREYVAVDTVHEVSLVPFSKNGK